MLCLRYLQEKRGGGGGGGQNNEMFCFNVVMKSVFTYFVIPMKIFSFYQLQTLPIVECIKTAGRGWIGEGTVACSAGDNHERLPSPKLR